MSEILLTKRQRENLRSEFSTSECTISKALHFKCNSILARRIRVYAVNVLKGACLL